MPLQHVDTLDASKFTVAPHVGGVDTFRMKNADGTFVADLNDEFIDKLVEHMNERERLTGDLSPIVIGHTEDGQPEVEAPPVVGFARNWHSGVLGNTGRKCAFFDAWIFNEEVERVKRYPRRSCEVWVSRYEVDPISLLGATTPARDLGLMKLSREGSYTTESPGEMTMPDDKKPDQKPDEKGGKPAADPKETGKAVHGEAKLDAILSGLQQLLEMMGGMKAPDAGAKPAEPGEGDDQMSDEEFEKLLAEAGGAGQNAGGAAPPAEESRAGEKPVQNASGNPGGNNTYVPAMGGEKERLSRIEQELADARIQLSRRDVKDSLKKLHDMGKDIDPENEALIADLIAMPPDMRARQLDTIAKLSRPRLGTDSFHLNSALNDADPASPAVKRIRTMEERDRIIKLARERNKTFEAVLVEEGYAPLSAPSRQ